MFHRTVDSTVVSTAEVKMVMATVEAKVGAAMAIKLVAATAKVKMEVAPKVEDRMDLTDQMGNRNLVATAVILLPHSHTLLLMAHQLTHILMKVTKSALFSIGISMARASVFLKSVNRFVS